MKNTSHIAKSKYPSPLGGETERGLVIGITNCGKWKNYHDWIARPHDAVGQASENTRTLNLSSKENNLSDVEKCDGIILSGGEDVHPRFYNKPEYLPLLDLKEINERRDEFELKVIEKTLKDKKPLLGICRGLQIANVYFGGTLVPNLPSINIKGHSKSEGKDQLHTVKVKENTFLQSLVKINSGAVNSAHHQAAEQTGKGLVASAFAEDGIVEAIEYILNEHEFAKTYDVSNPDIYKIGTCKPIQCRNKNSDRKSFFLLVQWHPERMPARMYAGGKEQESAFVKNIKQGFIESCYIK